jgi:hypothetical protein
MAIVRVVKKDGTTTEKIEHAGCVLDIWHDTNYRIMSDVWCTAIWAKVWRPDISQPQDVLVVVLWEGPRKATAEIDATDEVKSAYRNWLIKHTYLKKMNTAKDEAARLIKGCIAKIIKGRNAKGLQGKVVVCMDARYGFGRHSCVMQKLGIATSDITYKKALPNGKVVDAYKDMVWVWAKNCERVDVSPIDEKALMEAAVAASDNILSRAGAYIAQ